MFAKATDQLIIDNIKQFINNGIAATIKQFIKSEVSRWYENELKRKARKEFNHKNSSNKYKKLKYIVSILESNEKLLKKYVESTQP